MTRLTGIVGAVVVTVSLLPGCDSSPSASPPSAASPATTAGSRIDPAHLTAQSVAALRVQTSALDHHRSSRYDGTWAATVRARAQSRTIATNVRRLRVVDMHTLAVSGSLEDPATPIPGSGGRWTLDVDLSWRFARSDTGLARSRLTYTFTAQEGRVVVAAITATPGADAPLWLLGGLQTARSHLDTAAAGNARDAAGLLARLDTARGDIRRFLPDWRGSLTAVLPPSRADFEALLAASSRRVGTAAAVTTTVDGSDDPRAPVEIVVDPREWRRLSTVGAHVVITHEATHAATGAATSTAPLWLTEGFADYVAIRSAHVPRRVAAGGAIADVKVEGPPTTLPTDHDFAISNPLVERAYELSRLAVQTIARRVGVQRLVAFYSAVVAHPPAAKASWQRYLHMSPATLTRLWRRLLVKLAGAQ